MESWYTVVMVNVSLMRVDDMLLTKHSRGRETAGTLQILFHHFSVVASAAQAVGIGHGVTPEEGAGCQQAHKFVIRTDLNSVWVCCH